MVNNSRHKMTIDDDENYDDEEVKMMMMMMIMIMINMLVTNAHLFTI